jgi:hypothetical protein
MYDTCGRWLDVVSADGAVDEDPKLVAVDVALFKNFLCG